MPVKRKRAIDIAALDEERPILLIEAELLREDPSSNVIKIWKWAHEKRLQHPVLFVQSFTKPYRGRKRERLKRALFVASRASCYETCLREPSIGINGVSSLSFAKGEAA